MPASVAVPLILGGVGAGTSLVGAKMQSSAAKNAAKTQSQAAERALQMQQQLTQQALGLQGTMWEGVRGLYNPYTSTAPATLGALHSFLGIPGAAQAQMGVPPNAYSPMPMGGPAQPPPPPPISAFAGSTGGTAVRRPRIPTY